MTEILNKEAEIARLACDEMQPMPLNGADAEVVADFCEIIGEVSAQAKEWRKCANALRMACWYWKIAAHNPPNDRTETPPTGGVRKP